MSSPPPQPPELPLTSQWMRIMALSDCTGWRFSSRKYSPRGLGPVGCTTNAVSDVGAAPKLYTLLTVIGASVTHPRRAEPGREVPAAHQAVLPDPLRTPVRAVEVRQPEPVARLVRHRPDGHGLRRVARPVAPDLTLQDVVHDREELGGVAGPRVVRHVGGTEEETVGPEVILRVRLRAALATQRGLDEEHEAHDTGVRIERELGEVNGRIQLPECLREALLHGGDRALTKKS